MTALKPLVVSLVSCVIFFGASELAARAWIHAYGNALDITKPVLEADAELGWRQRPQLHTSFLNEPLTTDASGFRVVPGAANAGRAQILVLGPSSTFGWGVGDPQTYSAQLQALLASSTQATVINAGEIGYSSWQGVALLHSNYLSQVRPAAIVIAYGVNDIDRYRFYFQSDKTDAQEFDAPESPYAVDAYDLLSDSALLTVLSDAAGSVRSSDLSDLVAQPVDTERVPIDEFQENVESLVSLARSRGARPILVTTATDIPTPSVLPSAQALTRASALLEQAAAQWREKNYAAASSSAAQAMQLDPNAPDPHYYAAALAQQAGNAQEAQRQFDQARSLEEYRVAEEVARYNAVVRAIGARTDTPVLDLDALFAGKDRSALFVDPIHFSATGNALIASALRAILVAPTSTRAAL